MRRIVVLLMLFTGLLTTIAGIAELSPQHVGPPVFHVAVSTIFIVLCLIHISLNRRAVLRYIKGGK